MSWLFSLAIGFRLYFKGVMTLIKYTLCSWAYLNLYGSCWPFLSVHLNIYFKTIFLILHLWVICIFYLFCSLVPGTNFAHPGSPLSSFIAIIFYYRVLTFLLFFLVYPAQVFSSVSPYVPEHYCGRTYFLLTASKMTLLIGWLDFSLLLLLDLCQFIYFILSSSC